MQPGELLGSYRILGPLGSGGMGEVYRALDTKLDREVAVKVILDGLTADPLRTSRFEREAKALASLNHPNILAIHDFGREGETFYSVTELLRGQTLRDRLAAGRIEVPEALRIAREIAEGLAAAHSKGVIHRDLKPSNVFITTEGRVKILDFGLARRERSASEEGDAPSDASTTDVTRPGTVVGTAGYMSPEQVRGWRADARSDLFALGVILYEMLTGRRAFDGPSGMDVLAAILTDAPEPPSRFNRHIPAGVERLAAKLLEKDPKVRIQTAREAASAIEGAMVLSSGITVAALQGLRHVVSPLRALAIGVGALLVLSALAWWAMTTLRGAGLPPFEPRQITTRPGVEGMPAVSPDGTSVAYLTGEGDHQDLWISDLRGGPAIRLTTEGRLAGRASWYPDGSALLLPWRTEKGTELRRLSRFGGSAVTVLEDAKDPAVSPDGTRVAFAREVRKGAHRIWVATLGQEASERRLTGEQDGLWDHRNPCWSPDGRTLCYEDQNDLWLVPVDGGASRHLTKDEAADRDPVWSPDSKTIYFDSFRNGPWAIWRIAARGGPVERVTLGTGSERFPSLSADGRRLVYATTGRWLCTLVDRTNGGRTTLPSGYLAETPTFTPDGQTLLFCSNKEGGADICRLRIKDGRSDAEPERLSQTSGLSAHPSCSADGEWIVYQRLLQGKRSVWVMPSRGGAPQSFLESAFAALQPRWLPKGDEISFLSDRTGVLQVWAAPAKDGSRMGEPRQVTHAEGEVWYHGWSADGRYLAYIANDAAGSDVWIMPATGSEPPNRLTTNVGAFGLSWDQAAGAYIVWGTWGGKSRAARWLKPDGTSEPLPYATAQGSDNEVWDCAASPDGRLLCVVEHENQGNVWALDAKRGSF